MSSKNTWFDNSTNRPSTFLITKTNPNNTKSYEVLADYLSGLFNTEVEIVGDHLKISFTYLKSADKIYEKIGLLKNDVVVIPAPTKLNSTIKNYIDCFIEYNKESLENGFSRQIKKRNPAKKRQHDSEEAE